MGIIRENDQLEAGREENRRHFFNHLGNIIEWVKTEATPWMKECKAVVKLHRERCQKVLSGSLHPSEYMRKSLPYDEFRRQEFTGWVSDRVQSFKKLMSF